MEARRFLSKLGILAQKRTQSKSFPGYEGCLSIMAIGARRATVERKYTYWLPSGPNGERVDFTTHTNSVILVGANGCGKSKLGAWMERQEIGRVHRIGAQRNINISPHIQLKSYSDASEMMLYEYLRGQAPVIIAARHRLRRESAPGAAPCSTVPS